MGKIKYNKNIRFAVMALVLVSVLVGCKNGMESTEMTDTTVSETENADKDSSLQVVMLSDEGDIEDRSFNQSAWEGLLKAKDDFGTRITHISFDDPEKYGEELVEQAKLDNDLIITLGYQFADVLLDVALTHPDKKFVIVDYAYVKCPPNLAEITFKDEEAAFLAGFIAGKMTKTNKIGFIGGKDTPVIGNFRYGYMAGAKYANVKCEIFCQYANTYTNPQKGATAAHSMFNAGGDIIFAAAGKTGEGVIKAAVEAGKYAIGADRDLNELAPDSVLTSTVKNVGNALYNVCELFENDTDSVFGQHLSYDLANGGVSIADSTSKNVPEHIMAEVNTIKQSIIDGDIAVPNTVEDYELFLKTISTKN